MILTLTKIELHKIFSKWRSYIGFIAIGILTPIVQLVLYLEGQNSLNFYTQSISQSFVMVGNLFNGYLIANIILQALYINLPFLIVLVGGDLLAGEATSGTYRMLITRPITRFQLITSKFISGVIYTNLLLFWLMFLSLFVSMMIFGTGELIVLRDKIYIFASDDVMWRFIYAYGFATLSMTTVFALSFLFSSLVENAIGPIVASMAVIIIFLIFSALRFEFFEQLRPFFFTSHMSEWRGFFTDPINYSEIINSGLILMGHIVGLYFITLFLFKRKDILS